MVHINFYYNWKSCRILPHFPRFCRCWFLFLSFSCLSNYWRYAALQKTTNENLSSTWILVGVATCVFYAFISTLSLQSLIASSVTLGASIGIGIPTCFFFFANQTNNEGRGKAGAMIYFLIQLLSVVI